MRYIDDVFGIWLHGEDSLKQFHRSLNEFHHTIKFSLEHTGDTPSIPFLDTSVSITQDNTIATELYIKPTHSGILLHYSSAHPTSTKEAIAFSQMNRALRVSSTSTGSSQGMKKIAEMLGKNDYPTHTIEKSKKRATERSRTQQHRKKNDHRDGILRLPYISDEVSRKVRKIVQKSGLNVRIAQGSGPTLRSILTRSALEPPQCPNKGRCIACQAGLEGRCTTKNVIYRLDCAICAESYIGETKRPVRERLLEHRRAALNRNEQNPWGAHYGTAHKSSPVPTIPFTARIIRRAQDHVDRKLGEAIEIAETTPLLNTDSGWQLLPTIRKRSST